MEKPVVLQTKNTVSASQGKQNLRLKAIRSEKKILNFLSNEFKFLVFVLSYLFFHAKHIETSIHLKATKLL